MKTLLGTFLFLFIPLINVQLMYFLLWLKSQEEFSSNLTIKDVLRSDLVGPIYCTAANNLETEKSAPFNLTVYCKYCTCTGGNSSHTGSDVFLLNRGTSGLALAMIATTAQQTEEHNLKLLQHKMNIVF